MLLMAGGLSTVRPAPLCRLFSEFGAVYKYSDLLTYLYSTWEDVSPDIQLIETINGTHEH